MVNSRQKGACGEREFAKFVRDRGFDAYRGRQFHGRDDAPDIVTAGPLGGIHWEIKRVQNLNIEAAMSQAKRDCGSKVPMVAHRKNGEEWKITLSADDFFTYFIPPYVNDKKI